MSRKNGWMPEFKVSVNNKWAFYLTNNLTTFTSYIKTHTVLVQRLHAAHFQVLDDNDMFSSNNITVN